MGLVLNKAPNVFIGAVDTSFSNPNNWSQRVVPAGSDVAFINSNCTFDIDRTLGALIVSSNTTASIGSGRTVTVNGTFNIQGHLSASGNPNINLLGEKNVIASFSTGSSTVNYNRQAPQYIAGSQYHNLNVNGSGSKSFAGNVTVNNTFYLDNDNNNPVARLRCDCGIFNLSVFGTASINGVLKKSGPGNILFAGLFIGGPGVNNRSWGLNFTGNPNVEFRNGVTYFTAYGIDNAGGVFNLGSSNVNFTTNNQIFRMGGAARVVNAFINIDNITLTVTQSSLQYNNRINGTTANSKLENKATLTFIGSEYTPMATGIFDYTSSAASTLGYSMSSNTTLPYTFYWGLNLGGQTTTVSPIRSLAGNTTISGSLYIDWGANATRTVLECGNYNLTVSGSTTVEGAITKNGSGSILFIGRYSQNLDTTLGGNRTGYFSFSGNPSVEFRNGINMGTTYGTLTSPVNSGTGPWTFSTNDQIFNVWGGTQTITAPITINGNIVVTYGSSSISANRGTGYTLTGPINGTSAGSVFRIGPSASFTYSGTSSLMTTGILDASSSLNTFTYSTGSQLIKGGTYTNLTLLSGSKTLEGNVSVLNTLVTSSITLITGSFTLTNP